MTYIARLQHNIRTPSPGVMKFTILVDPSLVIITLHLVCLFYAWEKRRRIKKKKMHFHYMTYMAMPLHKNPCPGGHETYNFGRPFPGLHYYILSLYGPEKKIFMNISVYTIISPWGGVS